MNPTQGLYPYGTVRYISGVPALFGVAAIDLLATGIDPLLDFVEKFQVGDGLAGTHLSVRKTELIRALQEELAAIVCAPTSLPK